MHHYRERWIAPSSPRCDSLSLSVILQNVKVETTASPSPIQFSRPVKESLPLLRICCCSHAAVAPSAEPHCLGPSSHTSSFFQIHSTSLDSKVLIIQIFRPLSHKSINTVALHRILSLSVVSDQNSVITVGELQGSALHLSSSLITAANPPQPLAESRWLQRRPLLFDPRNFSSVNHCR